MLFRSTIDFSSTLPITTLTGDVVLFRMTNFGDVLPITTLTSDAILSGMTVDFSGALPITTLTGDVVLFRMTNFGDVLTLTTLTSNPILGIAGLIDFAGILNITTLTNIPALTIYEVEKRNQAARVDVIGEIISLSEARNTYNGVRRFKETREIVLLRDTRIKLKGARTATLLRRGETILASGKAKMNLISSGAGEYYKN